MAWEQITARQPGSLAPRLALSITWIAIVIAGAFLTNFDEPYLPFAIAGGLVFFLRSAPSRWEVYAWLLTSALFVKVIHLSTIPFWLLRVASAFALLGLGALLLLGLRVVWSEREARSNAFALLAPPLILAFFIFFTENALRFSGNLNPQTDDAWLYAFDGSLGFQPSFFMGRIMYGSILLTRSAMLTYLSLPFAMAIVCAWQIPQGATRLSWRMLTILLLAGVAGSLLYNLIPGTGPLYAFGKDFPWNSIPYKDLSNFPLEKMSLPLSIPRNAMPSLHMGWVVLLWWNSKGFPRALRAFLIFYLILTVVATLGGGQHYLIDLVASLPFVLTVQAAASYGLPQKSRRMRVMAAGIVLTAVWLGMVRFGVAWSLKSPMIPWTLVLVTTSTTFWLENWMSKTKPKTKAKTKRNAAATTEAVSAGLPKLVGSVQ